MRWMLFSLLVLVGLAYPTPTTSDEPPRPDLATAAALQETMRKLIDRAEPAIACVLVSRSKAYAQFMPAGDSPGKLGGFDLAVAGFNLPLGDPRRELLRKLNLADAETVPDYYGSGVVLDAQQQLVLTNFHVVRDATKVYVRLPGGHGSYADIHAADSRSDLAVLRLLSRVEGLKALPMGDGGKVRRGDWVISLANPYAAGFRDGSPSASWGIISNLRRRAPGDVNEEERTKSLHHYGTLLQTDVKLNLGCSGGALLNLDGELIGLTTALAALTGGDAAGGFAVPIDANMRRIIEVLLAGQEVEYGFLGVSVYRPEQQTKRGVLVRGVTPGSPAQAAQLEDGDVILAINQTPIFDYDDLFLHIGAQLAGNPVTLTVRSPNGQIRRVSTTLTKFAHTSGPVIAANRPQPVRGLRVDYSSMLVQMPPRQQVLRPGVVVREVVPGSPAERAQLRPGSDLITHVNGQAVTTPAEFYRVANRVPADRDLQLTIAGPTPGDPSRQVSLR
jgi:serine protease Do